VSTDRTTWPTALEETRNICNLDNRANFPVDLIGLDGESQVLGFWIGDSQPDDGWGACCYQHETRHRPATLPRHDPAAWRRRAAQS
jgi:hypothetical protein